MLKCKNVNTDTIYNKQIKGTLFNIDTTKIYEVALLDTNGSIFSKTESNIKGEYTFSGFQNYSFDIIVSVENKISDCEQKGDLNSGFASQ